MYLQNILVIWCGLLWIIFLFQRLWSSIFEAYLKHFPPSYSYHVPPVSCPTPLPYGATCSNLVFFVKTSLAPHFHCRSPKTIQNDVINTHLVKLSVSSSHVSPVLSSFHPFWSFILVQPLAETVQELNRFFSVGVWEVPGTEAMRSEGLRVKQLFGVVEPFDLIVGCNVGHFCWMWQQLGGWFFLLIGGLFMKCTCSYFVGQIFRCSSMLWWSLQIAPQMDVSTFLSGFVIIAFMTMIDLWERNFGDLIWSAFAFLKTLISFVESFLSLKYAGCCQTIASSLQFSFLWSQASNFYGLVS